jgi:DNA-binding PadR family transcriptional regulator
MPARSGRADDQRDSDRTPSRSSAAAASAPPSPPPAPMSPLDFHVLLVLAEAPLYGYAIMKSVESHSRGALVPEIGSLYRVIARLISLRLVSEAGEEEEPGTHRGRPRRYYQLTPEGRRALQAETERLRHVLAIARTVLAEGR